MMEVTRTGQEMAPAPTAPVAAAWRLRDAHGADLRHAETRGWLVWDPDLDRGRWAKDESRAWQLCGRSAQAHYDACLKTRDRIAADVTAKLADKKNLTPNQIEEVKEVLKAAEATLAAARSRQSVRCFKDDLEFAKTFQDIRIEESKVDSDPYLLGCPMGTIDLKAGAIRETRRADMISRASKTEWRPFDPDEPRPYGSWVDFMLWAMMGDEEAVDYMRLFSGYCLTGETSQECFAIAQGDPRCGKTTYVESVASLVGDDMSIVILFEDMCRGKGGAPARYDTGRMPGVRIVRSSESARGSVLDEGLICSWVGGEKVRGRAIYVAPMDFRPQFKLLMSMNARPGINPDLAQTGIWERMLYFPFRRKTLSETERDPHVKEWWTSPTLGGPEVLRWAVSGARDYIAAGRLPPQPRLFTEAREAYRMECDLVGRFLAESVTTDPLTIRGPDGRGDLVEASISCQELRAALARWVAAEGEPAWAAPAAALQARVEAPPWSARRARRMVGAQNAWVWVGVRAPDTTAEEPPATAVDDEAAMREQEPEAKEEEVAQ